MKKKAIGIAIAVMLLASVALVSCGGQQLQTPIVELSGATVSWQAVENADKYIVQVNDETHETTELSYTVNANSPGQYEITVKAVSSDSKFKDSENSKKLLYVVSSKQLNKPNITLNGNVISWNAVQNADKYEVYLNNVKVATQTVRTYNIDKTDVGSYSYTVKAVSDNAVFTVSEASNAVVYVINKTKLNAPVLSLTDNVVSWEAVANCGAYEVFVNGVSKGEQSALSYTIAETAVGSYSVTVIAKSASDKFDDSAASNAQVYNIAPSPLASPVLSVEGKAVSWSAVANAGSYEIFVNNVSKGTQSELTYTLTEDDPADYIVTVVAKANSAQYADSAKSQPMTVTVLPTPLAAPTVSVDKDIVSWNAVPNADGYEVYVNDVKTATVTDTKYILLESGSSVIQVVAVGSGRYENSVKSAGVSATIKGEQSGNETVAGETFDKVIVLSGDDVAKVSVNDDNTQYVWLRYFIKADKPVEYRVVLEGETRKTVIDWNTVGGVKVEKANRLGTLSGETSVGYEYVAVQLDLLNVSLGGEYKFTIETRTVGATLSITGFTVTQMLSDKYSMKNHPNEFIFADNVRVGDFGLTEDDIGTTPYYYSNFVPYGTLKTHWGNWLTFSYSNLAPDATDHYNYNDDDKYQAMSRYIAFDDLGSNDCYQLYMFYGNDQRDSHMLWKFTAFDPITGKTYILKDWFVWISGTAGENETLLTLDSDASKAVSGKNVILTWQCQPQEGVTGTVNRLFVRTWAIRQYSAPVQSDDWIVEENANGSAWQGDSEVAINSDVFNGELILKGDTNKATLNMTIDETFTSKAWITFFVRAKEAADAAAVPSTTFKLSMSIDGGGAITLIDWTKIGGTSSVINAGTAAESPVTLANDDYEIFLINLDNFAYGYAGKSVVFTLEQRDSGDGTEQELHMTGFSVTQRDAIVSVAGKYEGMSNWTTNWDSYVEFTDNPIPGGFLRVSATVADDYKYQGEATTVSFETLKAGDTLKFEALYGNYGNYGSALHKLVAIDCDTGKTYTLIDWEFWSYPGGGDLQYIKTIDGEIVSELAGKTNVQLIWQFNDTQKKDSVYNNRMYLTNIGFVIE